MTSQAAAATAAAAGAATVLYDFISGNTHNNSNDRNYNSNDRIGSRALAMT